MIAIGSVHPILFTKIAAFAVEFCDIMNMELLIFDIAMIKLMPVQIVCMIVSQ